MAHEAGRRISECTRSWCGQCDGSGDDGTNGKEKKEDGVDHRCLGVHDGSSFELNT